MTLAVAVAIAVIVYAVLMSLVDEGPKAGRACHAIGQQVTSKDGRTLYCARWSQYDREKGEFVYTDRGFWRYE